MSEKSRGNDQKRYLFIGIILALLLFFTRFVNLGWGLPYPFHPDERNMADAITQLHCTGWNTQCFNPHFFAYGQLPLYLGYAAIQIYHFFRGFSHLSITFTEAVLSLRVISALASVGIWVVLMKSLLLLIDTEKFSFLKKKVAGFDLRLIVFVAGGLIFIFSPAFIQFAHFGTTESLLMLFYSFLIYLSLLILNKKIEQIRFSLVSGIVCGLAVATKSSALSYLVLPALVVLFTSFMQKTELPKKIDSAVVSLLVFGATAGAFALILSPYNAIAQNDFLGSMQYESAIGVGSIVVFYTRQFIMTLPILFQFTAIFPYALGLPVLFFFILSFFFLPFNKNYNLLRFAFLLYFLPSAFLFAKWTRFVAPVFPVMVLMAVLILLTGVELLDKKKILFEGPKKRILLTGVAVLFIACMVNGLAYLSVYIHKDVRFTASEWIYKNIPSDAVILSETANVVDLPILSPDKMESSPLPPNYRVISFNFYEVETQPQLVEYLKVAVAGADYIIIPSRRVFANHTCVQQSFLNTVLGEQRCTYLKSQYPALNEYYDELLSGKLGFQKIKEFSSYPSLVLGRWTVAFPDEEAEETWTVFDHPVVRVYKKIKSDLLYDKNSK